MRYGESTPKPRWLRTECAYDSSPRVIMAGWPANAAFEVLLRASGQACSSGRLSALQASDEYIDAIRRAPAGTHAGSVATLVRVGLLALDGDGYVITSWDDYQNPETARKNAARAAEAARATFDRQRTEASGMSRTVPDNTGLSRTVPPNGAYDTRRYDTDQLHPQTPASGGSVKGQPAGTDGTAQATNEAPTPEQGALLTTEPGPAVPSTLAGLPKSAVERCQKHADALHVPIVDFGNTLVRLHNHWAASVRNATGRTTPKDVTEVPTKAIGKRTFYSVVLAALDDGRTWRDLADAIAGCLKNPENVKGGFYSWELIFRDAGKIDQYIAWNKNGAPTGGSNSKQVSEGPTYRNARDILRERGDL